MAYFFLPSLVGLLLQATSALLMATLGVVLLRTVRRAPLAYWSIGWVALFVALTSLWLSFYFHRLQGVGQFVYLFGEYLFGYLVIAGCRHYVDGRRPRPREAWLVAPAAALAAWLPRFGGGDFNVFFAVHTLIYAYLFFAAFRVLRRARPGSRAVTGVRVMKTALLLLAIDYFHYAPIFAASSLEWLPETVPYLTYAPFYDLIFGVMLMFGMVMVMTGDVQNELEAANRELAEAHDRMEALARLDHLTSALNRHAFYSLVDHASPDRRPALHGCVAIADIDGLKAINDRYGHAAGDAAIRAVASALRACIRADDLLVRWGGDEFLIVLFGVTETQARERLASLNAHLRQTAVPGVDAPVDLSVSIGCAPFDSAASLDDVVALADRAMYREKQSD